jgi:hypothetical protein
VFTSRLWPSCANYGRMFQKHKSFTAHYTACWCVGSLAERCAGGPCQVFSFHHLAPSLLVKKGRFIDAAGFACSVAPSIFFTPHFYFILFSPYPYPLFHSSHRKPLIGFPSSNFQNPKLLCMRSAILAKIRRGLSQFLHESTIERVVAEVTCLHCDLMVCDTA